MKDLTVEALYSSIDKIIYDNQEGIRKALFAHTDDSMTTEEIVGYVLPNCLSLSVKLSVQLTLEILQSQDILEIDEHEIAKLYLKHLLSEKEV